MKNRVSGVTNHTSNGLVANLLSNSKLGHYCNFRRQRMYFFLIFIVLRPMMLGSIHNVENMNPRSEEFVILTRGNWVELLSHI
jgi:hypothetical protein